MAGSGRPLPGSRFGTLSRLAAATRASITLAGLILTRTYLCRMAILFGAILIIPVTVLFLTGRVIILQFGGGCVFGRCCRGLTWLIHSSPRV